MSFMGYVYSIVIVVGCSYIVFWKGHSPWWFVAAFAFIVCVAGGDGDIVKIQVGEEN